MRIGIDLGGTKIEGIALDNDGTERARRRIATPREYAGTIEAIAELVESIDTASGETGTVGVGIPGVVTPSTGLVKNANSVWLNGQPLMRDLEARLTRAVRVANDAECFVLSEATDGAAVGAATVFGVILGTGVGGGIVVNGQCVQGPNLIAGEWGHNSLPWPRPDELDGPTCYCGKFGCIESWLSGPGFEREYAARTGVTRSARGIVSDAELGDDGARAAVARYHDRLARALASIVNVLDPWVIVLGGGMSNTPRLAESVAQYLPQWVFSDQLETRVVRHQHGDSSGVRGAAWLWPRVVDA